MSEEESFLERWARRKRDAAKSESPSDAKPVVDNPQVIADTKDGAGRSAKLDPPSVGGSASAPPPFDLTKLPPLDSITAATDIRAFMLPGVPAELSRAALRRAWSADPAIREFVGLADYDWDFNTEGAIPGFGPLEMTEELRRRVSDMVGRSLAPEGAEPPESAAVPGQTISDADENAGDLSLPEERLPGSLAPASNLSSGKTASDRTSVRDCEELGGSTQEYAAPQKQLESPDREPEVVPRRHGRALPT